jgi:hypothetical protein
MAGISREVSQSLEIPSKKKVVALLDSFSFCLKRRTKVKCPVYREISGGLGRYFLHHFQLIFNHFQGPLTDNQ